MRIALDTQVSPMVGMELEACGHECIRADEAEMDHNFFKRAEEFGAELFVSADYDWMNYALDRGKAFFMIQQKKRSPYLTEHILREIRRLKFSGYPSKTKA